MERHKKVINNKSKNRDQHTCISDKSETISDPTKIANSFNEYFSTIPDNIQDKKIQWYIKIFQEYLTNPTPNSFVFFECDAEEISSIISSFNPNKAVGPNSIFQLKFCIS